MREHVVVITGAASGIGAAAAEAFAEQGANLALLDRNERALQALSTRLWKTRTQCTHTVVADLSTEQGVIQGIQDALIPFAGRVDVLIANVGILVQGLFEEQAVSQWKALFDVNVFGVVAAIQTVLPAMQRQGRGTILITGSDQGLQPDAGLSSYAASKAALHSLTKTLAREQAPFGIRVNAVAPGMTRTPLVQQLMEGYALEFGTDTRTAEHLELCRRGVPAGRLAEPEEVAQAMVFLVTTTFQTGCILDVSGGNVRGL